MDGGQAPAERFGARCVCVDVRFCLLFLHIQAKPCSLLYLALLLSGICSFLTPFFYPYFLNVFVRDSYVQQARQEAQEQKIANQQAIGQLRGSQAQQQSALDAMQNIVQNLRCVALLMGGLVRVCVAMRSKTRLPSPPEKHQRKFFFAHALSLACMSYLSP